MTAESPLSLDERNDGPPALLRDCQAVAAGELGTGLGQMMSELDDVLFEMANRAGTNSSQTRYFDAMRELRIKRAGIEEEFRRYLLAGGSPKGDGDGGVQAAASAPPTGRWGKLSLVDNSELEQALAVRSMVRRVRDASYEELQILDRRVGVLLGHLATDGDENPLGPERVCGAMRQACQVLESDLEVTLVILKLFEKQVTARLPGLYQNLNSRLAAAGVKAADPADDGSWAPEDIGASAVGAGSPGPGASRDGAHPTGLAPAGSLATGRSADGPDAGRGGPSLPGVSTATPGESRGVGEGWPIGHAAGGGPVGAGAGTWASGPVGEDALGELLQHLQGGAAADLADRPSAPASAKVPLEALAGLTRLQRGDLAEIAWTVPGTSESRPDPTSAPALAPTAAAPVPGGVPNLLRAVRASELGQGLGPLDQMTIDLVAMMFDYILADRNLPDRFKALIGRLQIPVLKAALLDRALFARRSHPVRRLLDLLASAAVGWNERHTEDDDLYRESARIVDRVLQEFESDLGIFSELLAGLEQFLAREAQQASLAVDETTLVIQGREQLRQARASAGEAIHTCLEGAGELPVAVRELLEGSWRELLVLLAMQRGPEGDAFQAALQTMRDLVWSVTPKRTPTERRELVQALPGLVDRVRQGLDLAGVPADQQERTFSTLAGLHVGAVRSGTPVRPTMARTGSSAAARQVESPAPAAPGLPTSPALSSGPGVAAGSDAPAPDAGVLLQGVLAEANRAIFSSASSHPQYQGMGATVVATVFRGDRLTVCHAGDTRLYRLREGELVQLTRDHSVAQDLVDKGFFTPEQARQWPQRHVVTRAVGMDEQVCPDVQTQPVCPGDLYLLCSDGLSDLLTDADLQSALGAAEADLQGRARGLVSLANDAGGDDNISVVLVRVVGVPASPGDVPLLEVAALTDVGRKRAHNEDAVAVDAPRGVAVVADGMGGANAGEVASALAVRTILAALGGPAGLPDEPTVSVVGEVEPGSVSLAGGVEDIVLASGGGGAGEAPADEPLERVRRLQVGDWVEFRHPDGCATRARLTWTSPATDRFLFTNRRGQKVMDASAHGLAVELRRGTATVLDRVPMLDRAVSSLTERLMSAARTA
jgi:serine/threonine protein phosphatase PrpC